VRAKASRSAVKPSRYLQVDRDHQAADWSRLLVHRALCGDPVEVEVVTVASPVEWSHGLVRASLEGGGLFGSGSPAAVG